MPVKHIFDCHRISMSSKLKTLYGSLQFFQPLTYITHFYEAKFLTNNDSQQHIKGCLLLLDATKFCCFGVKSKSQTLSVLNGIKKTASTTPQRLDYKCHYDLLIN